MLCRHTFSTFQSFHFSQSTVYQYLKYLHACISQFGTHLYRFLYVPPNTLQGFRHSLKIYVSLPSSNTQKPAVSEIENTFYSYYDCWKSLSWKYNIFEWMFRINHIEFLRIRLHKAITKWIKLEFYRWFS